MNLHVICRVMIYHWYWYLGIAATAAEAISPDRAPGLLAEYRTLNETAGPVRQIDPKPSFTWGISSPHPRLPAGQFEVEWTGEIDLADAGVRFGAVLSGAVYVSVNRIEVLRLDDSEEERRSVSSGAWTGPVGRLPIRVVYRSPRNGPARLQLWWEADTFAAEPVPAYRFSHNGESVPVEWRLEEQIELGRRMAGQLGCARCHRDAFPGIHEPAPGPRLSGLGDRVSLNWLREWLEDPRQFVSHARMPRLFPTGRAGFVERTLVAENLLAGTRSGAPVRGVEGDHRIGRQSFVGLGCATCHTLPEDLSAAESRVGQTDTTRTALHPPDIYEKRLALEDLGDRFNVDQLAEFLRQPSTRIELSGYDRLDDGVRLRFRVAGLAEGLMLDEEIRVSTGHDRKLIRRWRARPMPEGLVMELNMRQPEWTGSGTKQLPGAVTGSTAGLIQVVHERDAIRVRCSGEAASGQFDGFISVPLPAVAKAKLPTPHAAQLVATGQADHEPQVLSRPGYRAIRYPMPKTSQGEDRIMPAALATDPETGRLYVLSLKLGELFVLHDPAGHGQGATYRDYARGLFQDAFGLFHDGIGLFVLHRRNITRLLDQDYDGVAERFDRVIALPHSTGNRYDWAYGPVRDKTGAFVISFAPHANNKELPGMGGVLRINPQLTENRISEIGFGLRNAVGWTAGPEGELFFTDNQGEWVPANKLCHVMEGANYGYPNPARLELAKKPRSPAAVWVPYHWAKSINGVTYDNTGGKFGPFSGQFFMAELMHGGAIVRAQVEKVNGVYQGACFPFWSNNLLGPLVLAFDPAGRLFVGSITQPAWMAQPDRGALFRIDYTGEVPFEIQSIHVSKTGFRLRLTRPAARPSAESAAQYAIEHYRYEFTGAYGSPELDRTVVPVQEVVLDPDCLNIELRTAGLVTNRIYSISAHGVRSMNGEPLVHPTGVYTLNVLP